MTQPAARRRLPKGLKTALKVLLPMVLLALVWHWLLRHADFQALAEQAQKLPAWAWLAAGLALMCGHSLRALRLQRQWHHLRPVGLAHCLRLVLTHCRSGWARSPARPPPPWTPTRCCAR